MSKYVNVYSKRLPAGGMERAYWDAVGFYEDEGHSPKKAEALAEKDLKVDYPTEWARLEAKLKSKPRARPNSKGLAGKLLQ